MEPHKSKDEESSDFFFQTSHENYEVIQNEISYNIERLSQRVDERIENGLNRNLNLFEDKLAEALSSKRNNVESVVSVVSGLENRERADTRVIVHTPTAKINPEGRALGVSLNDVHRPIYISVWENGNLENDRQTSFPNNQIRQENELHGETVHHIGDPKNGTLIKFRPLIGLQNCQQDVCNSLNLSIISCHLQNHDFSEKLVLNVKIDLVEF